jgi:dihydrofolate synthase/folylpolyglutamate synthase
LKQDFKKNQCPGSAPGFEQVVTNTGIRGRWEILQEKPLCICDTGHNQAGLRMVTEQLAATPHKQLHIVLGVVNDKDIGAMLELLPQKAVYYFTKAAVARALPEKELAKLAAGRGLKGQSYPTVAQAKTAALEAAAADDLVFIGGSNFTVAEAL